MASDLIKKHLEELKNQKTFDEDFIDILAESNENGEDGETTAARILKLIKQRYAQSKENNA